MLPKHANIRLAFTVVSVVPTTFSKPEVKGQTTLMYLLLTVLVAQQLTFNQSIASRQYCFLSASIVCSSRQVEDCKPSAGPVFASLCNEEQDDL